MSERSRYGMPWLRYRSTSAPGVPRNRTSPWYRAGSRFSIRYSRLNGAPPMPAQGWTYRIRFGMSARDHGSGPKARHAIGPRRARRLHETEKVPLPERQDQDRPDLSPGGAGIVAETLPLATGDVHV